MRISCNDYHLLPMICCLMILRIMVVTVSSFPCFAPLHPLLISVVLNRYGAHKSIRISRPLCLPWPADDGINVWRCICTTHIFKRLDYIFCGTCMWRHLVWWATVNHPRPRLAAPMRPINVAIPQVWGFQIRTLRLLAKASQSMTSGAGGSGPGVILYLW